MTAAPDGWFDNEHPALARCWHPVAETTDLRGSGPHPIRLLGRDLALFPTADGWAALPDTCPHRLAPLTAGTAADGVVRCAYHGWCFDGAGRCVEIPALGPDAAIPPTAHLSPAAATTEAYGLVWLALEPPLTPFPTFEEWGDPAFGEIRLPVADWRASAAQMADNFLDVGHFPFTHTATIGNAEERIVADYTLDRDGWVFRAHHRHTSQALDGSGAILERTMDFACTAPHHVVLRLAYAEQTVVLGFFHQPVDADITRVYCIELDTDSAGSPETARAALDFQLAVAAEDRTLLEQLRRKAVPLRPGHETHTRADRITVELRRVLADLVAATSGDER